MNNFQRLATSILIALFLVFIGTTGYAIGQMYERITGSDINCISR